MKRGFFYGISFILGAGLTGVIGVIFWGKWDFYINIIDALTLLATITLSIVIYHFTKRFEKNGFSRDIIVSDLEELCKIYECNSKYLLLYSDKKMKNEELIENIRMVFHKSDLQIDCIISQLKESFPNFIKDNPESDLIRITTDYFKWLSGGDAMISGFNCDSKFKKEHEIQLMKTTTAIKVVMHKLIKYN